jgi:DNA-binding CsgD family transcriptional regulator
LDKAEIHELLEDGQSIAEIAEAQGIDPESLISDVTDAFRERFSEKVYG